MIFNKSRKVCLIELQRLIGNFQRCVGNEVSPRPSVRDLSITACSGLIQLDSLLQDYFYKLGRVYYSVIFGSHFKLDFVQYHSVNEKTLIDSYERCNYVLSLSS